jgi:fermentation-respiration switch protein FrsA (DUF1100 family)
MLRAVVIAYLLIVLAMALFETALVYPIPPARLGDWNPTGFKREDVRFTSADGTKLHGWMVPYAGSKRAVLYCHGNGEHVAFNADLIKFLSNKLRANVFIFDYRGYGRSEGRPNEAGCIADGRAAQRWLAERVGIQPRDVVLIGRSLGGGVAVALAAEEGARALVLESTFPSMPDAAACHYPWLPVRWAMDNQYDSIARIAGYDGPLLQSHGTMDEIIPSALGRRLFDAAPSAIKKWIDLPALGHNSPWPGSYYDRLAVFLEATKVWGAQ